MSTRKERKNAVVANLLFRDEDVKMKISISSSEEELDNFYSFA